MRVLLPLPLTGEVRTHNDTPVGQPSTVTTIRELHVGAFLLVHVHLPRVLLVVPLLVPLLRVLLVKREAHLLLVVRCLRRRLGLPVLVPLPEGVPVLRHHRLAHFLPLHGQLPLPVLQRLPPVVPLRLVPQLLQQVHDLFDQELPVHQRHLLPLVLPEVP